MNEMVSLVAAIPVPINSSTVIVQAQDPWMTFLSQILAVIVGGIIVFGANYALQMHSFRIQNETNRINRRNDAYIGLLGAIIRYEKTSSLPDDDLMFHISKASIYGSLEMNKKINDWLGKLADDETNGSRELSLIKLIIVAEIGLEEMVDNKKWKFWKKIP